MRAMREHAMAVNSRGSVWGLNIGAFFIRIGFWGSFNGINTGLYKGSIRRFYARGLCIMRLGFWGMFTIISMRSPSE